MNVKHLSHIGRSRRAATIPFTACMITVLLGMIAFAVDAGYVVLVRTQLQTAADAAAMAASSNLNEPQDVLAKIAQKYASYHSVGQKPIDILDEDIQVGIWDATNRTFTPTGSGGNAVKVTARRDSRAGGKASLFFGRIFGSMGFDMSASAVAMANPRDIAFVVDLSGSMNNDTESCWATVGINNTFGPEGYPNVGTELLQDIYDDFGYGKAPGKLEYLGKGLVSSDRYAFAELTKNGGPLYNKSIPKKYRIGRRDSEKTRKVKGYSYIIDYQIANVMPNAQPAPNSSKNYAYWEKYLDYIVEPVRIGSSGKGTKPKNRGYVPYNQDSDRVTGFGNPKYTFVGMSSNLVGSYRNRIGYQTYVQYMMDYGWDLKPDGSTHVPLSVQSPYCPYHDEATAGGTFSFPPREQPTHAARRALIAALQIVKERNESVPSASYRDWVSIVTFDRKGNGTKVVQDLTSDYEQVMEICTQFQAVGDKGYSTATETGMIAAKNLIKSKNDGGTGRIATDKVVVLLTDGAPNLYSSSKYTIDSYISSHPSNDFYSSSQSAFNASIMQAMEMSDEHWSVFPVGIGLGTNYTFMDRLARAGGTANDDGESPRGSGNPAEYEQRLTEIFEKIITTPQVRLVQ